MATLKPGKYQITFVADVPENIKERALFDFIEEWMECGGGCRHPDDPLFQSLSNVEVLSITRSLS